ncbi:hypothetical protein L0128_05235 [candidate division KSB1 bacterium]|nr:hypothetical protein [candidate division KSB1 bacterium]
MKDLTKTIDQTIWISNDRVSALISRRCSGIEQIDFHGNQPVSRNAKLLQTDTGVLQFIVEIGQERIPIPGNWSNVEVWPAAICFKENLKGIRFRLEIVAYHDRIGVRLRGQGKVLARNTTPIQWWVDWNPQSMATAVHGQRTWKTRTTNRPGYLCLQAADQIDLTKWLTRAPADQIDYLIPEEWRRMIFKRRGLSGLATAADVREEYLHTELKLYDAPTWLSLGGAGFEMSGPTDNGFHFCAQPTRKSATKITFPSFSVQFFTQPPANDFCSRLPAKVFYRQARRYRRLLANCPSLWLEGYPAVTEFFNTVPAIVDSARVQDFGLTRACPGTYYWLWSWDNLATGLAMSYWGDIVNLRRLVDFVRIHRDIDGRIPMRWTRQLAPMDSREPGALDFLFSEVVLSLFHQTQDRFVLQVNYPSLHHAFTVLTQRVDHSSLIPGVGFYPDAPLKMGRTETSLVAMEQGALYTLARNVEKIAGILNDNYTATRARELTQKIETYFLAQFWDAEQNFLVDAWQPLSGQSNQSFPLFSLFALESPLGYALISEKLNLCAQFIQQHLLHPDGLSLTADWDPFHRTEPVMSAWYPHWDVLALKIFTATHNLSARQMWLKLVEQCYTRLGYCPEFVTLGLDATEQWTQHGSMWNLNCAAGWYLAILHAIIGLEFDLGGITCRNTAALPAFRLTQLFYRGGYWEVTKSGNGRQLDRLVVDGQFVPGTLKVPSPYYTHGQHTLQMIYGDLTRPRLRLETLWGAEILKVTPLHSGYIFTIQGFGQVDGLVNADNVPQITLDALTIPCRWDTTKLTGIIKLELNGKHELKLEVK